MYWINANNDDMRGGCRAFEADTTADIKNLPTSKKEGVKQGDDNISCQKVSKGSTCLVISPATYYKLNSQDEWVLM